MKIIYARDGAREYLPVRRPVHLYYVACFVSATLGNLHVFEGNMPKVCTNRENVVVLQCRFSVLCAKERLNASAFSLAVRTPPFKEWIYSPLALPCKFVYLSHLWALEAVPFSSPLPLPSPMPTAFQLISESLHPRTLLSRGCVEVHLVSSPVHYFQQPDLWSCLGVVRAPLSSLVCSLQIYVYGTYPSHQSWLWRFRPTNTSTWSTVRAQILTAVDWNEVGSRTFLCKGLM